MKIFSLLLGLMMSGAVIAQSSHDSGKPGTPNVPTGKKILITGGRFNSTFIRYVAALTGKPNPRVCFVPTASADNIYAIAYWYQDCTDLPLRPYVLRTFINASPGQKSFEEDILSYDAIIVGGGSTLNMLAVWKAQGIDTVLRKAYEKGIVLAGGSAGSLCWFSGGYTDSRPKELTLMDGLGFLPFSHAPHYHAEPGRRPLFLKAVEEGRLPAGYACDDEAGLLFVDGKVTRAITLNPDHHSYFVSMKAGKLVETAIDAEIIR